MQRNFTAALCFERSDVEGCNNEADIGSEYVCWTMCFQYRGFVEMFILHLDTRIKLGNVMHIIYFIGSYFKPISK